MATASIPRELHAEEPAPYAGKSMDWYRMRISIAVIIAATVCAAAYLYETDANAAPLMFEAATGANIAHAASAASASSSAPALEREVHIAQSGLVLVRGALVTAVSKDTVYVSIGWGSAELQWVVDTDDSTSIFAANGEKGTLDSIYPGQYLSSITGQIVPDASQLTIRASFVRI